ncbi:M23 family metallopeptidase [Stenotrophomonas sp. 364]|uniref:M23 family metallopeptidase n=1 Tax=Stenotrophomonas sp. 364 TaxID=2691571 RepID=UPI001318A267|nr:M23 family metallopeptidase [Stenotrophomonas sp. 364]QHB72710.1 peptidoglycan DD-metalloendopeptidase family protein [Stenotrophomonas sp. 364]
MKLTKLLALGLVVGIAGWWWLGPVVNGPGTGAGADATPAMPVPAPADPATLVASSRAAPTAMASSAAPATPPAPSPAPTVSTPADGSALLLPVQGITAAQLQDTFTDARSEGRVHDAIDILAPAGTPVLAVADGTIEKLFNSDRGGLTVYQFEPGGRYCYYYAHLERYADGLAEKQTVTRGQVIGYVGSTGNASPEAPHLHFEIHTLGPEKHWWEGASLNPYPVLRGEQRLP